MHEGRMSRRTWLGTIVIVVALVAGLRPLGGPRQHAWTLQSNHAAPAAVIPAGEVLITPGGKMFHRPGCSFLHGHPLAIECSEAVRRGYTPCVRCESELLRR